MKGRQTARLFDILSWSWRTRNHSNFVTTTNCYKIITCDPLDDTVDLFGNLVTGVASQLAQYDYDSTQFRQFFKSLRYLFEYENQLYEQLSPQEQEALPDDVYKEIAEIEVEQLSGSRRTMDPEISEEISANIVMRET